jgi:hypothetical protein
LKDVIIYKKHTEYLVETSGENISTPGMIPWTDNRSKEGKPKTKYFYTGMIP